MDLDLSTIDNGNLQAIVDFNYKKILKNIMDHTTDPNIEMAGRSSKWPMASDGWRRP